MWAWATTTIADTIELPRNARAIGGKVYFTGRVAPAGFDLYVTDAAMQTAKRVIQGETPSEDTAVGELGARVLVERFNQDDGGTIWSIDPVGGGRERLAALPPSGPPYTPRTQPLGAVGARSLFLVATNGEQQLWSSDDTAAGTHALLDHVYAACALPQRGVVARRTGTRFTVWGSDGTAAGSTQAFATTQDTYRVHARRSGGFCYFVFARGAGWELWRSDGTANGSNILAQSADGTPRGVAVIGSIAYVLDATPQRARLWRSDAVQPVVTHDGDFSEDAPFEAIGNRLAYVAPYLYGGQSWTGLFVSDGTAAGTQRVGDHFSFSGPFYCALALGSHFVVADLQSVWNVDPVTALRTPSPLSQYMACSSAVANGIAVGTGFGAGGEEAWRSDGSAAGTYALQAATDRLFASAFER
jgi:ELWxxDGT repeat protein